MMAASLYCALALSALSLSHADYYGSRAVDYGYGVVCSEDVAGYGCEHHRKTTTAPPTTTEEYTTSGDGSGPIVPSEGGTTKPKAPVGQIIGGVVGAGVAAAGVGLIAAAIHQNMLPDNVTTTMNMLGEFALTTAQNIAVSTAPAVVTTYAPYTAAPTEPAVVPELTTSASIRKLELKARANTNKLSSADKQAVANHGVFGLPTALVVAGISLFMCGVLAMVAGSNGGSLSRKTSTVMPLAASQYEQVAADIESS